MVAMVPRWVVVDKLVHELGSLRAAVQEVEAQPELQDADVTLELRACLSRAADVIHLVIGGDEALVSKAWHSISEAQEVSTRARAALARARAMKDQTRSIRDRTKAQVQQVKRHLDDLQGMRQAHEARRASKRPSSHKG